MSRQLVGRVVTVSDRSAAGERPDTSGPLAASLLAGWGVDVGEVVVVPDEVAPVVAAVSAAIGAGVDVCLTTGGTGLSARDVTPEAVTPLLERLVPGIAEALRQANRDEVPTSVLSRGVAGVSGRTLVVTLPGSSGGVRDGVAVVGPLLAHIADQLNPLGGAGHDPR